MRLPTGGALFPSKERRYGDGREHPRCHGQAAAALAIGRTLLYRLAMSREIASIKVGGARRFPLRSLEAYIERLSEVQRKR